MTICTTLIPRLGKVNFNNIRKFQSISQKPKSYKTNFFEDECYAFWNYKGAFKPKKTNKIFSIILPPPNVTGSLHIGHALTISIEDAIARWKRMSQNEVVWIPGVDHAGIATQVIVEKSLMREKGITRFDIGRNKFTDEVLKWKDEKSSFINMQMKKLGASMNWEKGFFTMDDNHMKAVTQALLQLHEKNLIYRDESLINWSPQLRSAISDIEVNYKEVLEPTKISLPGYSKPVTFGNIVDFSYRFIDTDEEIVVSTTRIETMLGDVAIAVNPEDNRFKQYWGRKVRHPFNGTELPIITDKSVDPSFGTGAVKITPAHDPNDFKISKRHNLPKRSVINEDGLLLNCGQFSGMRRFEAREAICDELSKLGLLKQIRPHSMRIPICSRSGDVIEYLIKPQWFIKTKHMAERAINAVKCNELIINPENYQDIWFHWLENIQDWCISRQLWWGHQLPFYYCESSQGCGVGKWIAAENEEDALNKCKNNFPGPISVKRDPDVLDTWFSSGILPFTCFGWPQHTELLKRYYPLSTLVTGNDILFFWVARMVMLGLELTNQLPFKEVFLHGIICDSQGRKMSKSLGNIIAPEDVIYGKSLEDLKKRIDSSMLDNEEITKAKISLSSLYPEGIPEYGVDALRFSLLSSNVKSQFINFDIAQCSRSSNFCNKIWQACNFAEAWSNKLFSSSDLEGINNFENYKTLSLMEDWILEKLNCLIEVVNSGLEKKDFHVAASAIRNFVHLELCDIYIESIKPILREGSTDKSKSSLLVLLYSLNVSLKCLSPFMPFMTEYLYQNLPINERGFIMESTFPTVKKNKINTKIIERVSSVLSVISEIRRIKNEIGVNYKKIEVWIEEKNDLIHFKDLIENLAKCEVKFGPPNLKEKNYIKEFVSGFTVYFQKDTIEAKMMNNPLEIERKNKLKKQLAKLLEISSSEDYKQKAPENVKISHYNKVVRLRKEIKKLEINV